MRELRDILHAFSRAQENTALATIVRTTGSSYRRPGARMLILPDAQTIGTLSGGCIEEEIAQHALPVIATGEAALVPVDTLRRFGCPGTIEVFVERIAPGNEFLTYLQHCLTQRLAAEALVVFESSGELGSFSLESVPVGASGFLETIAPPIRLVIVGNGHGTDTLHDFATTLGWEICVVSDVAETTEPADARTAIVVRNQHFGRDFAALQFALAQPFGYIGLLGSRKRREQVLDALIGEGVVTASAGLRNFFGPAGLDLGADSPQEIALSIIAEIQAVMAQHAAGFLRDRRGPIHDDARACPAAQL